MSPSLFRRSIPRRSAALILALILVAGTAALARGLSVGLSCLDVAEGSVQESQEFVRYDARLTVHPERPILRGQPSSTDGASDAAVPGSALDGQPLRLVIIDGSDVIYQFFLGRELDDELTPSGFAADGGIRFNRMPLDGGDDYVSATLKSFPDRAVAVQVGGNDGVLTWADPDVNGLRPHHLYWTDGTFGYELIAVRSAASIVNLARGLACGG